MGREAGTLTFRAVQHLVNSFNNRQIYSSDFDIFFLKGKQSYFVLLINTNSFSSPLEARV